MKHVKILTASALIACGVAGAAQAESDFAISGNVALTSDYLFRGISQTDNDPAIQGGFDLSHSSGLYAGIWASNIAFDGSIEVDYYAGFSSELANGIGYDLSFLYYDYPTNSSDDYYEYYGALSYDFGVAAVSGKVSYSPDFFAGTDTGVAYEAAVDVPLPSDFSLGLGIGYQEIDDNQKFGADDYTYYSVGVSTEWLGVGFDLTYSDTDLSDSECFGGDNICDDKLVFSISKEL